MKQPFRLRVPGLLSNIPGYYANHPILSFKARGRLGQYINWLCSLPDSPQKRSKIRKASKLLKALYE